MRVFPVLLVCVFEESLREEPVTFGNKWGWVKNWEDSVAVLIKTIILAAILKTQERTMHQSFSQFITKSLWSLDLIQCWCRRFNTIRLKHEWRFVSRVWLTLSQSPDTEGEQLFKHHSTDEWRNRLPAYISSIMIHAWCHISSCMRLVCRHVPFRSDLERSSWSFEPGWDVAPETVLVQLNGLAVIQYGKLFTSTFNCGFIYFCYNQ